MTTSSFTRIGTWALLPLFYLSQVTPALLPGSPSVRADSPPALLETPASPPTDPDPRNETSIAVSAVDDRVIVGASKVIVGGGTASSGITRVAYYYSSDGGRTWGDGVIPLDTPQKTWSRASDPSVAADTDGNFYLGLLTLDNSSFDSGVYVLKSTDGGRTFNNPAPAVADIGSGSNPKLADKCYITVDTSPSSPFRNTVYAVWTSTERNESGQNAAFIKTSHLRPGDANFSAPKILSHAGDMRGPSVATGPNGELYAAWEGIGNPKTILFNASTDGGETFLPLTIAPSVDISIYRFVGSLSQPSASLIIAGVPRMNSFPVIAVDHSSGPNRGMIYVVWAETANRIDSDIFLTKLTPPNGQRPDIGAPVRVNNSSNADQFFPWLTVDSSTGAVEVAFYDRRDDPAAMLMNLYLARSTDGGATFTENLRVSQISSDPRIQSAVAGSNGFAIGIGDYIGLAAGRGKAHLLWADTRSLKQEIFYGQVDFMPGGGGGIGPANDNCSGARPIAAAPFTDEIDTRLATSAFDDPVSCSGGRDTNTVWYQYTPSVSTTYAVDTAGSDYDTVLSVYTGGCEALTRASCSDDFPGAADSRPPSLLIFQAQAGTTYLIEVSGKAGGGSLRLRLGYPAITGVGYTPAPDGSPALKITGAGFVEGSAEVIVQRDGADNALSTVSFDGQRQGDGTFTALFASRRKLKKLVKPGIPVIVRVESPAGSGRFSLPFSFTR